jgi:hypothetical protein
MSTAAFQETIQDGVIRLPKDTLSKFNGMVNVIVWQVDENLNAGTHGKRRMTGLLRNPVRVSGFKPLGREECHER